MSGGSVFTLSSGNELAHALIAHLARDSGIRVLSIKGFVADRYGLREPRVAADADVMIDPRRFNDFCALLGTRGWHPRHERPVPSLLGRHSITYIHDSWPNDIDVHLFFPGFLGAPQAAFDSLWATKRATQVAHVTVLIPSLAGAAVIGALHALRYTHSSRHATELEAIKRIFVQDFEGAERQQMLEIAQAGGAMWVMRDVFEAAGITVEVDAPRSLQQLWNTNQATVEDG